VIQEVKLTIKRSITQTLTIFLMKKTKQKESMKGLNDESELNS